VIKIFINGFGRIGQSLYKLLKDDKDINIVGINDIVQIDIGDIPTFAGGIPADKFCINIINAKTIFILIFIDFNC